MGVALTPLLETEETNIDNFSNKRIAVDAMNMLYQFVTTIRQPDGTPLKDSKGFVTSHLIGLFSRVTKLMTKNIKLVFVFDGKMPPLKALERKRRELLKAKAAEAFEKARETGDFTEMKKFASQTTKVTPEMIEEAKLLLEGLGIPHLTAPSEGEAQAAFMVESGDCDYVSSQDIDCLIYGSPKTVRNLSISNKRKKNNALSYTTVLPEIMSLEKTLQKLEISLKSLRALAMLVGTDFNIGGVKGIGPKKGLGLVKKFGDNLEGLFQEVNFDEVCQVKWQDVYDTIANMPKSSNYKLVWNDIDKEKLISVLVRKHEFSLERVERVIEALENEKKKSNQTSLGKFF